LEQVPTVHLLQFGKMTKASGKVEAFIKHINKTVEIYAL